MKAKIVLEIETPYEFTLAGLIEGVQRKLTEHNSYVSTISINKAKVTGIELHD